MQFFLIIIVLTFVEVAYCQWQSYYALLTSNTLFTQKTGPYASSSSGSFLQLSTQTTANFITCTTPLTSYITLNNNYLSVQSNQTQTIFSGYFVAFDLYFQGIKIIILSLNYTWQNQLLKFEFGSFEYLYYYLSPPLYSLTSEFCDNIDADVKTVNFSITTSTTNSIQFISNINGGGQVSIRNLIVSSFKCYPSCSSCGGPGFQQCTGCFFQSPTNGVCPTCPSNQYYMKYLGCKNICDIGSSLFYSGFCQNYQIQTFVSTSFTSNIFTIENLKWSLILDSLHIDNTLLPNIYFNNYYIYGIFKYNSGVYRFINELSTNYATHLIGFKITLFAFNDIPTNCGIQFKIIDQLNLNEKYSINQFNYFYRFVNFYNNTYYGSIYSNASGIQTHNIHIYEIQSYGSYQTYSSVKRYILITYFDIPKNPFIFSAIGNYTILQAGWGINQVQVTAGFCPYNCKLCEVQRI